MAIYLPAPANMRAPNNPCHRHARQFRIPRELRRSLACTNIIENVMGTVRRVCWNVKYCRSPSMAMRWTAAAMQEARR
jgi:putative transposase